MIIYFWWSRHRCDCVGMLRAVVCFGSYALVALASSSAYYSKQKEISPKIARSIILLSS